MIKTQFGHANKSSQMICTHSDGEHSRHPVQVVRVLAHLDDLRQNRSLGPIDTENVGQLFQVDGGRLSYAEDGISQPGHTEASELFVKELHSQLGREQGDVFDDGLTNSPLLVFGELHDGGQESSGELLNSDDCRVKRKFKPRTNDKLPMSQLTIVDHLELADEVQSDLGELVLQKLEEQGQEVFLGRLLSEQRSETTDLLGQSSSDMLRGIGGQGSNAREDSCEDDISVDELSEA